MSEDQIWIIVSVVVVILVLRALTVKKLGSSTNFGQMQQNSTRKPLTKSGTVRISSQADAATIEAVRQMLEGGRFIEAVKYVRETKKIGLKEAKLFVESVQNNQSQSAVKQEMMGSAELATRAKHLRDGGHKIEAIKFVQDQAGMDLASAKRFVEGL